MRFAKVRKFIKRCILTFFTACAIISFFNKFSEKQLLPSKFELVWEVKPVYNTPVFHDEESNFMNLLGLYHALSDNRVTGLKIFLGAERFNTAFAQELWIVLSKFKASGKHIEIWANYVDGVNAMLVFSSGEKRYLKKEGVIAVPGYGMATFFYKKRNEKKARNYWGVQNGLFKGGLSYEMGSDFYFYDAMNKREYLLDLLRTSKTMLSYSLNITDLKLEEYFRAAYFNEEQALEAGLVHAISAYHPAKNRITLQKYAETLRSASKFNQHRVCVVCLDFPLLEADGGGEIVSDAWAKAIMDLADDSNVKVVLLWLGTPGGNVTFGDKIEHAVQHLRKKGKYVIAYVHLAASAGYQIASCADKIFAVPGSTVGSIGNFLKAEDITQRLKKKGIEQGVISTHEEYDGVGISDKLKDFFIGRSDIVYEDFVRIISENRHIPKDVMYDIAQGQIYSGVAGYALGLVDALSGIDGALDLAFSVANKQPLNFCFLPDISLLKTIRKELQKYHSH